MPQIVRPEKRANDIRALLEKHKGQITAALPKHITTDRMLRVALTAINKTPMLLEAEPKYLFAAILQAAQLGLEPDGALGQAYLIPYRDRKKNTVTVQFQPGYRGLLSLVRRSNEVSTIEVRAVHAKDHFRFQYGINPVLEHTPFDPGAAADPSGYENAEDYGAAVSAGPLIAAYAIARMKGSGDAQWDVMRRHEIDRIRSRSSSRDSGPWVTDYDEMAKKTVLKRLCKLLPMSVEASTAIDLDDKAEVGIPQDLEIPAGVKADEYDAPNGSALEQLTQTIRAKGEPLVEKPDTAPSVTVDVTHFEDAPPPDVLPLEDATPPAEDIPWEPLAPPDKPTKGRK